MASTELASTWAHSLENIIHWHQSFSDGAVSKFADWLSIYGFAITCIGLIVSAYAAYGIRQIKARFAAKARLPSINKRLQKDASALSDMAELLPLPRQDVTRLLTSINADLNAVKRHLPRALRSFQKTAKQRFAGLSLEVARADTNARMSQLSFYWETYESIQLLKNEIDHHLADEKWDN